MELILKFHRFFLHFSESEGASAKLVHQVLAESAAAVCARIKLAAHCYSEISDFSSRRAEFGRLAVLGCTENLPEPLDGVTV